MAVPIIMTNNFNEIEMKHHICFQKDRKYSRNNSVYVMFKEKFTRSENYACNSRDIYPNEKLPLQHYWIF